TGTKARGPPARSQVVEKTSYSARCSVTGPAIVGHRRSPPATYQMSAATERATPDDRARWRSGETTKAASNSSHGSKSDACGAGARATSRGARSCGTALPSSPARAPPVSAENTASASASRSRRKKPHERKPGRKPDKPHVWLSAEAATSMLAELDSSLPTARSAVRDRYGVSDETIKRWTERVYG